MKLRQKLLLEELLREGNVKLPQLSVEFSVSMKTLHNDLSELADFLREQLGGDYLTFGASEATFTGSSAIKQAARTSLKLDDFYLFKLSADERVVIILSTLLSADAYVTIGELAEQLFVSRGTINSDLHLVKSWCSKNRVQVDFKKSRGILLREDERRRRELFAKLIQDFKIISGIENSTLDGGLYTRLFEGVNMSVIKDVILEAEEKFGFTLSDVAYEGLVVHIALSVRRDQVQPKPPSGTLHVGQDSVQYRMAAYIVGQLNEQMDAGLNEASICYITLHIFGRSSDPQQSSAIRELPYAQDIAERLIMGVSRRLRFDFHTDNKLYDGLRLHLIEAISRMQNHLSLINPIKDTLIAEYRDIYDAVCAESVLLTHFTGCEATEDELAYIVIHFASAMERDRRSSTAPRRAPAVILVCGTGEGTARLVQDQVNRYFDLDVVAVASAHRLEAVLEQGNADFIISTVPLTAPIPVILVGPIIRDAEIAAINRTITALGFTKSPITDTHRARSQLASAVLSLIHTYGCAEEEDTLFAQLTRLVEDYPNQKKKQTERTQAYMLSEVLREEYIALNQEAADWQQAVKLGGGQLVRQGAVEPEYIQAAIQNVKDLGPYIVLTKGVAIPHAGAEYGVHRTAISLVSLREPVCFGNPDNDPVRYIFTLATTDSQSHLQALKDLVGLLENEAFFSTIDHADNPGVITAFIKDYEAAKAARKEGTQ